MNRSLRTRILALAGATALAVLALAGPAEGAPADTTGQSVYIADTGNGRVVEVDPAGVQTTVAAGLSFPFGVAVDAGGNVYIADAGTDLVVKVTPAGAQTAVPAAGLNNPFGVAVDAGGNVYIADSGNHVIRRVAH